MKLIDIEPILHKVATYFEYSPESVCDGFGYDQDEVVDAMGALLRMVAKKTDIQRKKAMLPENHGKPWFEEDVEFLKQMFIREFDPYNEKVFYIKASKKFGRKEGAIRQRLEHMWLIKHPYDPEYAALMIKKNS